MQTKIALVSFAVLASGAALSTTAHAAGGTLNAELTSYQEVPAISSRATGQFDGTLSADETTINWTLTWKDNKLTGPASQAHIHFSQEGVNGAIVVFLCTNLGNGPMGTPACPTSPGDISGTIDSSDVIASASMQGIDAGQMGKLVRAIRAGAAYVNIHTASFPSGEIRGQVSYTPDL